MSLPERVLMTVIEPIGTHELLCVYAGQYFQAAAFPDNEEFSAGDQVVATHLPGSTQYWVRYRVTSALYFSPGIRTADIWPNWYGELWKLAADSPEKVWTCPNAREYITHLTWSQTEKALYIFTFVDTSPSECKIYQFNLKTNVATLILTWDSEDPEWPEPTIDSAEHGGFIYTLHNAYAGYPMACVKRFDPSGPSWDEVLNFDNDFGSRGYAGGIALAVDGKLVASDGANAFRSATGDSGDWTFDFDITTFNAYDNFCLLTNKADGHIYGGQNDPVAASDPAIIKRTGDGVWVVDFDTEDFTGDGIVAFTQEYDSAGDSVAIYGLRWSIFNADPPPQVWRKPTGGAWTLDWDGPANTYAGLYSQGVAYWRKGIVCLVWSTNADKTQLYQRLGVNDYELVEEWDDYRPLNTHANAGPMCMAPSKVLLCHQI